MTSPEATRTRWERFQLKVNLNSSDQNRLRTILQGSGNEVGSRLKRLSPKPPSLEASQPHSLAAAAAAAAGKTSLHFTFEAFSTKKKNETVLSFSKKTKCLFRVLQKCNGSEKKKKNGRNLIWVKIKQAALRWSILDSLSAFGFSRLGDLRILNRLQNSSLAKVYKLVSYNIFFS